MTGKGKCFLMAPRMITDYVLSKNSISVKFATSAPVE